MSKVAKERERTYVDGEVCVAVYLLVLAIDWISECRVKDEVWVSM